MTTDYKLRQEMFHHLFNPDDRIEEHPWLYRYSTQQQLVDDIKDYFTVPVETLLYPSKSYAVAVIYAKLLRKYFGVPVLESLRDPDLLYGNDKFFEPYQTGFSADVYNSVIFLPFNVDLPQVAKTIEYFKQEFFLYPNPYFNNSSIINTTNTDEDLEWEPHTK